MSRLVEAIVRLARWVFVRGRSHAESQERARDVVADADRDRKASEAIAAEYEAADIEEHRRRAQARNDVETSR